MRGLPGRSRANGNALQQDQSYDIDGLISIFTKKPVDDGVEVPDPRIGQIAACRLSPQDGVYIWTATFLDGGRVEYKVEELAHAIRRSRDLSAA
ncbi:hypothetical protein PHMEG_00021962 [Phytophthora megakarya]|uniref:Uncharacterized protein n=1 Tax=Phytophthora megakarya TaxID=4795 RepID=A0A225VJW8_9STRA|nr:hypothetical protein PHMEG_00021962 [Phytophthora megakarya]